MNYQFCQEVFYKIRSMDDDVSISGWLRRWNFHVIMIGIAASGDTALRNPQGKALLQMKLF
jgi:hypothetical protein